MSKKVLSGRIKSVSLDSKTVVVDVERTFAHAKYKKVVRTNKCYHSHNIDFDKTILLVGSLVEITECIPVSKTKKFKLTKVL